MIKPRLAAIENIFTSPPAPLLKGKGSSKTEVSHKIEKTIFVNDKAPLSGN